MMDETIDATTFRGHGVARILAYLDGKRMLAHRVVEVWRG
jgi:hypothetical protein